MHSRLLPQRVLALSTLVLVCVPGQLTCTADAQDGTRFVVGAETAITEPGEDFREPHLVIHPAHPDQFVVAAMKKVTESAATTDIFRSVDSGKTWTTSQIHDLKDATHVADPWLAFGAGGTLFYSVLASTPEPERSQGRMGVRIYHSADGGGSWADSAHLPFMSPGSYDKPSLAVAPGDLSRNATVYVAAQKGSTEGNGSRREGFVIARSVDNARTFSVIATVAPNNLLHNVGHPPVTLSDGTLVVPFFDFGRPGQDDSLLTHPRLWVSVLRKDAGVVDGPYLVAEFVEGVFPMLVADISDIRRDRLYMAWTGSKGDRNIYVASSGDTGRTWSTPVRVNSSSEPRDKRYKPMLVVDTNGHVGVTWKDSRDDPADRCTHVYFTVSVDGGRTFVPEVQVSSGTTCSDDWWADDGEYFGVAARHDGGFQVVWPDNRDGSYRLWTRSVHARD